METKQVELIFKNCHHYDDIVNFDYNKEDFISKKIITYYQDYILDSNNKLENQNIIQLLDNAVNEYVKNPKFYRIVQSAFEDIISNELVYIIVNLYRQFEDDGLKDIENTKWL